MPTLPSDISGSYAERRDNTPNDALKQIMIDPTLQPQGGASLGKPAEQEELPFIAKYPNLYGMYGAVKEVGKSLLPWAKYIDPEERENFWKLSQQEQVKDLLLEDLNFVLLGRWNALGRDVKYVKDVIAPVIEQNLPKTYNALKVTGEFFTKPRSITGAVKEEIKAALPKETPKPEGTAPPLEKPVESDIIPPVAEKPGTANIPAKENPVAEAEAVTVFHGSKKPMIEGFDPSMEGTGIVSSGQKYGGIFFTTSKENASFFADYKDLPKKISLDDLNVYGDEKKGFYYLAEQDGEHILNHGPFKTENLAEKAGGKAVAKYNDKMARGEDMFVTQWELKPINPLEATGEDVTASGSMAKLANKAKKAGHDALIVRDYVDGSHVSDIYVAFDKNIIKPLKTTPEVLTVYHGTGDKFTAIEPRRGIHDHDVAVFTDNPKLAEDYAASFEFHGEQQKGRVIEAQIELKNPLIVDAKGKPGYDLDFVNSAIAQAKKEGHDGVVIKNIVDDIDVQYKGTISEGTPDFEWKNPVSRGANTDYIVFNKDQIKNQKETWNRDNLLIPNQNRPPEVGGQSATTPAIPTPTDIPVVDSDDAFKQIQKLASDWDSIIETQRRGTRTHAQARLEGGMLGMTPDDARAISPGTAMNDSQSAALIDTVNDVATSVHQAAKKAVETGSDEDMQAFLKKFLALGEVDPARWGVRSESGRTLSVMNEPISGINQYLDQFSNALKASETMTPERLAKMVSNFQDAGGLAKTAIKAGKPGPLAMLFEAWINWGLLSGPVSHAANIAGSVINLLLQPPVRFGAAISGAILPGEQQIPFRESAHLLYGMLAGIKSAFRLSAKAFIEGKPLEAGAEKIEWQKAITAENMGFSDGADIGRAIDLLGETVRGPGRFLMTEDEFFKAVAYRAEVEARAVREGIANGFEKEDLTQFVVDEIRNPSKEIKNATQEFAKYITFQTELGSKGKKFQDWVASSVLSKIVFPFVKAPTNIFKVAGELSPLAPFAASVRADIAAGGAARDLALSRIALGTSIMTVVASYVADGRITGSGPSDPDIRAALMRLGWLPNAIKIGAHYYQYGRLEPFATILGVAASAAELAHEVETDDIEYEKIPSAAIMAISKNVLDKTFTQGASNLVLALEDPDRYGKQYIRNLAGTVVPALSAQTARALDGDVKAVNSVMDAIKARTVGWSKDLPKRLDLWGEPIAPDTWGPMILSPIRKSKIKESLADTEIVKNRVQITMPEKQINGVVLTPQEYNRFVELAGKDAKGPNGLGAKEAVDALVKSPNYERQSDGPDGGKALMLKTTIYLYRELARKTLLNENPDLAEAIRAKITDKQAAMMPNY